MDKQLGMLDMLHIIIRDWDDSITPEDFTETLLQHRRNLIEFCEAYEEASFKVKLEEAR